MRRAKSNLRRSTLVILASGIALLATATRANAAPQCLRSIEIDADHAIRSDTKLIVLSDTCTGRTYVLVVERPQAESEGRASESEQRTVPKSLHAARGTSVNLTSTARQ